MTTVEGIDSQPATLATAVPDTREERALPRSEAGIKRIKLSDYDHIIGRDGHLCLNDTNWVQWHAYMMVIFRLCGVEGYVKGTLPCPDPDVDPESAENWSCNDSLTWLIISQSVTWSQIEHILACDHAHEAWRELEAANQYQGFKTMLADRRKLCHTTAEEGDNIIEHLDKLKRYRRETNVAAMGDKRFEISDFSFNLIIAQSFPPSWDYVTSNFVDIRTGQTVTDVDSGTMINSQQFMEIIEQEYRRREQWDSENIATHVTSMYCKVCKRRNHDTEDCRYLGKPRCTGCGKFGHFTSECRNNKGKKRKL